MDNQKMENKVVNAVIQARMGSTRLPGKVLMDIDGVSVLEHIIKRLRAVKGIGNVIVATSNKADDDAIADFCNINNVPLVRGSEDNVLDRFGLASRRFPADAYIRATGDNPMIDIELIENMLAFFWAKELTYTCYRNYPIGSGVEIFTHAALSEALEKADRPFELEHVTPYMYQSMGNGRVEYYVSSVDDSRLRMTIDTESDLIFAREIFKRLYKEKPFFGISDVKRLLADEPALVKINSDVHQKALGE